MNNFGYHPLASIQKVAKILCFVVVMISFSGNAIATHLMGGELTYEYSEPISGGAFYNVKLIVYRYCDQTNGTTAPLDQEMFLGIYVNDPADPSNSMIWYNTEIITLTGSTFVTAAPGNANCPFQPTACIERGEYFLTILLPDNADGYHLLVERCCRNGNIVNLTDPGSAGMSYYAFIPPGMVNSSPQISDISVPYICTGDTVSIINNAFDPDGDSLAYSFVIPYNGNSSTLDAAPDPITNTPYALPIMDVTFAPGYSQSAIFGAGGYASIDPVTGLTKYYIPNQGFYVAAIEIREYRNGVLISAIRRDLQFITIVCTPNEVPVLSGTGTGGIYTVGEGQQICFNVSFDDADGDSLFLVPSGPLLDPTLIIPTGIIASASGSGTVSSQFCWTPICGMSRPAPYQFSVTVTDNGCPQKTSSQVFSIYVTSGPNSLTPTVSIIQDPPGVLCQGSMVKYYANPTLPGNNPQYFWYLNGIAAGGNDSLFSPGTINDGDIITVTMVSNATCIITDTAYSPPFVADVNTTPAPQINITSNPSGNLCPQQICFFTATTTNGGAVPTYQWNLNGIPSGNNLPTFNAANPSGIMSVYVTLTPSTGCPPQESNVIIFNIQPYLSPDIVMNASVLDSICQGEQVTFTVESSTTGYAPVYNWLVNGVSQGVNTDTLILSGFTNGDVVNVSVTSSYPCLSPAFTYAEPLAYFNYPQLEADLTDGPIEICAGLPVELLMNANGGKSGTHNYLWSYGNSVSADINFVPPTSGYYVATVDDYCYDPVMDSIYIEVLPVPESEFSWTPEKPTIFNPFVQFTDASIDATSWNWELGEQIESTEINPSHEYLTGGIFPIQLVTTNDFGCTDTLVKPLEVINYITAYLPNSFTPNGDGKNEEFSLVGFYTGGYSLSIYNRWGQEIFTSSGPYDSWNGSDQNGNDAPAGIYIYRATVNNDKTQKPITGTITLVR